MNEIDTTEKQIEETEDLEDLGPLDNKALPQVGQDAKKEKPTKRQNLNWKDKFVKIIGLIDRVVKKRFSNLETGIDNADKQLVAGEWDEVMKDYEVNPPRHLKLAIAILVTVAVVLDSYWSVVEKVANFKWRRKKDGSTDEKIESTTAERETEK
jgi:hypothetical protein